MFSKAFRNRVSRDASRIVERHSDTLKLRRNGTAVWAMFHAGDAVDAIRWGSLHLRSEDLDEAEVGYHFSAGGRTWRIHHKSPDNRRGITWLRCHEQLPSIAVIWNQNWSKAGKFGAEKAIPETALRARCRLVVADGSEEPSEHRAKLRWSGRLYFSEPQPMSNQHRVSVNGIEYRVIDFDDPETTDINRLFVAQVER